MAQRPDSSSGIYHPPPARNPAQSGHPSQRRRPLPHQSGHPTQRRRPLPNQSGHPTQRRRPAPQHHNSGGGHSQPRHRNYGGGGGGGGGGTGRSSGGTVSTLAAPAAPPPPPDINTFLAGDDTYQAQVAAIAKALSNYKSQMGERQGEYNADFTNRLNDLNTTEQRSTSDQADDYAGRGMYISGLYGKARGDLEQDFNRREGDMDTAKTSFMNGLGRDYLNFQEEQSLTGQNAKQEAINRRALKYSL